MKTKFTLLMIFCSILGFSQNVFDVARKGTLVEMKEIMKANKKTINQIDERSFSPLILACYHRNIEVAEFLIENVENLNYVSNQGSALAALCINYDKNLVQKLLDHKANPNVQDNNGVTPLIWAVKMGNAELVQMLLHYGADKKISDKNDKTAFEYAINSKNLEIINLLKSQ